MNLYEVEDGTIIDLSSIIAISTTGDRYSFYVYCGLHNKPIMINNNLKSMCKKEINTWRSNLITAWRKYSTNIQ